MNFPPGLIAGLLLGWKPLPAVLLGGATTALTKLATGYWAARWAGLDRQRRFRVGTALVARGEFSIVIAALGAHEQPEQLPGVRHSRLVAAQMDSHNAPGAFAVGTSGIAFRHRRGFSQMRSTQPDQPGPERQLRR